MASLWCLCDAITLVSRAASGVQSQTLECRLLGRLRRNPVAMLKTCRFSVKAGQLGVMTMSLQHVLARSKARGLINGSLAPDLRTAMAVHGMLVLEGDVGLAAALLQFARTLPSISEEDWPIVCEGETVTPSGGLF